MRAADLEACLEARHADGTLYADDPDYCRRVYAALARAEDRPLYDRPRTECLECGRRWPVRISNLPCPRCGSYHLRPVRDDHEGTFVKGGHVSETECPVCDPEGYLDKGAILTCPLCHGCRLVPVKTARWYLEISAGDALVPRRAHRGGTFKRRTATSTAIRERVNAR